MIETQFQRRCKSDKMFDHTSAKRLLRYSASHYKGANEIILINNNITRPHSNLSLSLIALWINILSRHIQDISIGLHLMNTYR